MRRLGGAWWAIIYSTAQCICSTGRLRRRELHRVLYSTVLYLLYLPYSILTHVTLEDVERYIIMYVEYSTLCGGEAVNNADSAPPLHGLNGTSSRNRLPRCTPYTRR